MLFAPEVKDGCGGRQVLFSRVLHVPELSSNLLSVLYLVKKHDFHVHISSKGMEFEKNGTVLFRAPIDDSNTAYLAGQVVPAREHAEISVAFTLPLTESLWHCCLCLHLAGVHKLLKKNMVAGMKLSSSAPADPICEPCLSGKLNAAPFPSSTSTTSHALLTILWSYQ